jgi:hypothetical protein|tara:strand:- start:8578 stop:11169 length:2592 start_codon:yes stop_codon:yes gene_type:complete
MSALSSFFGGANARNQIQDQRYARSLQQKSIQLAEDKYQIDDNTLTAQSIQAQAGDLGLLAANGFDLDPKKVTDYLQKGRDSGRFSPEQESFVTSLINLDSSVTKNAGFKFKRLAPGPDNTLTVRGDYDGNSEVKTATIGGGTSADDEVAFADATQIGGMLVNQYNQLWSKKGPAALKNEIRLKTNLSENDQAADARTVSIQQAVGEAATQLEDYFNSQGPEGIKIGRKLKASLAGVPYDQQLEVLQDFEAQVGLPVTQAPVAKDASGDPTMNRSDGSKKSAQGYLGPVKNSVTGGTMTEVSIGVEIDGKEMEIPAMVPTLTQEEINTLSKMELEGNAKNIPASIKQKAEAHARQRIAEGKSVFYEDDEGTSTVAPETAKKAEKIVTDANNLPSGPSRDRTRITAQAKTDASNDAKAFVVEAEASAEEPEEVPEGMLEDITSWVKENPADAALLAVSGALTFAGPIGWAVRGGISAVRASPAALSYIARMAGSQAKRTVTKPKFDGPPRNAQGQITKKGEEARVVDPTKAATTAGVVLGAGTAIKIGSQEFIQEAEDLKVPPAVVDLAEETADVDEENIVKGTVQVSEEAITALKESLNLKGIKNLQDMNKASVAEQQALRAVLSVLAKDEAQAREYNTALMNVMETGSASYNLQELDTARVSQQNADSSTVNARTTYSKLKNTISQFSAGEYGKNQKFVEKQADQIGKLFIGKDDEVLDPTVEQYEEAAMGPNGAITKLYGRLMGAKKRSSRANSPANRSNASTESGQMEKALLAQISYGLQFVNKKGDLEWSIETDSGAALSGGDSGLSRIARDGTKGGVKILKPGTTNQDGDAFTALQISEFFGGNQPLIDFFYKKLDEK